MHDNFPNEVHMFVDRLTDEMFEELVRQVEQRKNNDKLKKEFRENVKLINEFVNTQSHFLYGTVHYEELMTDINTAMRNLIRKYNLGND